MNWYHAAGGAPQGPISEEQLRALAQQGVVKAETLVWCEGMANWQPYGSIGGAGAQVVRMPSAPSLAAGAALRPGEGACAECGKVFAEGDMIRYQNYWVCAACKPVFLQRLQEGAALPGAAIWRSGKKLVMNKDAQLPDRCVKCNQPASPPALKRNLSWHSPWLLLLILINLLIYIVVAGLASKRAKIAVGLCARHWTARKSALAKAWSLFAFSLVLIGLSIYFESGVLISMGILTLIVCLFYAVFAPRMVYAARIDDEHIWIGGAGREFLDGFPEWPGK